MPSDQRNEGITITCLLISPKQSASRSIEIYYESHHFGTDGVKVLHTDVNLWLKKKGNLNINVTLGLVREPMFL